MNRPSSKNQAPRGHKDCVRCKRARWLMTFLMLSTMLAILYLNHFAA